MESVKKKRKKNLVPVSRIRCGWREKGAQAL
jgi:hypothetical protein